MNLFTLLNRRSKPITIGIIGAGKFATMFFAQALKIPSIHIVGVVDIKPENAKSNMEMVGWDPSAFETIIYQMHFYLVKHLFLIIGKN